MFALMLVAALLPEALPNTETQNGMTIGWSVVGDRLNIAARAPTSGWLVVGFNDKPGLDGGKLVFMRVRNGRAEAEVHRTDFRWPAPFHRARTTFGGTNYVKDVQGTESAKGTVVSCAIPLVSGEPNDVKLTVGQTLHITLAYSVSDDYDHHSRMRTTVKRVLQ